MGDFKESPVLTMRGMINSMHILYAINCGIELGLFRILAKYPQPVALDNYVSRTKYDAKYVIPWLRVVQAAGIINIDSENKVSFNKGWQEALTDENSSNYIAPLQKCHLAITETYKHIPRLFRNGTQLSKDFFTKEIARDILNDGVRFANYFVNDVLKTIPSLQEKLERGATAYDIGCGSGMLSLKLAQLFPASRFVGFDTLPVAIEIAQVEADKLGVKDNIRFENKCATELPENIADCILLNEVLHEMEPDRRLVAFKAVRRALKPGGVFFLLDILAPEEPADYTKKVFMLAALCQFFETPWGSKLPTYSEVKELLSLAGFGEVTSVDLVDNVFAGYVFVE